MTTHVSRLSIAQVARQEGVDPATVYRWLSRGLLSRSGLRVRLAHRKRGGRVAIEPGALEAFFSALSEHADNRAPMVQPSASVKAEQRAEDLGL